MADLVEGDLTDHHLKKHVAAIHIENRLSLLERKIANVLLFNAYPKLLSEESHKIRVKDLANIVDFDSNDRDYLKSALINLISTVFTWNIVDNKGHEKVWRARPMLMSADIEGGWCIYAYHPDLREKLFNPEIYSRINLSIQAKFTSGYALALYENCLRFRRVGSTGWLELDTLRMLIGAADNNYYTDFRRLNSKVIKPAVEQVNKTSDIFLESETKRQKRRVVAIKFCIKDNPQMPLFAPETNTTPALPSEVEESSDDSLYERLSEFGLRQREINRFLNKFDTDYINENLDIVATMSKTGVIKTTLRATTLDALKTDYRPEKTPFEVEQEKRVVEENRIKAVRREEVEQREKEKQDKQKHEEQQLEKMIEGLSEDSLKRFEVEFIKAINNGSMPEYAALLPIYRKNGLSHSFVKGCFRDFLSKQLLEQGSL